MKPQNSIVNVSFSRIKENYNLNQILPKENNLKKI